MTPKHSMRTHDDNAVSGTFPSWTGVGWPGSCGIGDVVKDRIENSRRNRTELIEYITAR